jgi:ADP-heptose:LPS heptosyltransferase
MKILLIRTSEGIGDLLMLTPVIKELASKNHTVDLLLPRKEIYLSLFKHNKHLNKLLLSNNYSQNVYDKIINLNSVAYPYELGGFEISRTQIFAKACNVTVTSEKPIYAVEKKVCLKKCIGLHFFGAEKRRSWGFKKVQVLIKYFLRYTNFNLLLLDTVDLEIKSKRIISCKSMDIEESASHLAGCMYFIGVDSCWLHFAKALNVPGIVLFGSTNPKTRVKENENITTIYTRSNCRGCFYKECDLNFQCMEEISVRNVVDELKKNEILL